MCRSPTRRACRRSSPRARHGWWPAAARCARRCRSPAAPGAGGCSRSRARASEASALVLASSLGARAESLEGLRQELLLASPLALLLATLAGYLLAGAALRPVEAMRRKASAISAATPGSRLPVPPARDEVSRLAETLNEMLERLETAFEHERRFVADASHELRTPLALLRTELELALRHPRSNAELEDAIRSAAEETERLTSLAADLLVIARADQGKLTVHPETVSVSDLYAAVAASVRGARRGRGAHDRGRGRRRAHRRGRREAGRAGGRQPRRQRARARGGDGEAVGRSPRRAGSSCMSRTRARASRRASRRGRSTGSAGPTRRGRAAGAGSGWRSSGRSPRPTAARPASRPIPERPMSGCRFRPGGPPARGRALLRELQQG